MMSWAPGARRVPVSCDPRLPLFFPETGRFSKKNREAIEHERAITERDWDLDNFSKSGVRCSCSCPASDHFGSAGIGIGGVQPIGTALVTEFAPRRIRTRVNIT
jgi:hypothetical protein